MDESSVAAAVERGRERGERVRRAMTIGAETAGRLARMEEQLKALPELRLRLDEVLKRMDARDREIGAVVQDRETFCAGQTQVVSQMRLQVDDLTKRMQAVEQLMPAVRVMMWVGAGFGLSLIALIWALITGQAQVVFP